ncbi:MAG: 6-carboxytetrahydropterin synthase QueD, partial [Candidatus Omnitrophica bacterium]|nr:6-carboxytetrahydropterin synthase QueD [Candidatus Omnitrophota bacterium]
MFELMVESTFSAAHRLKTANKKCERLHGHNWKIQLFLSGSKLKRTGILLDFKEIKEKLEEVVKPLDHQYLNEIPSFKKISPTSENIAYYLYQKLTNLFAKNKKIKVAKVTVWES